MPLVVLRDDGSFDLLLPDHVRAAVAHGIAEIRELILVDGGSLQRLFPPAHPDDEAREAEWRELMAGQLVESRLAAFDVVEETLHAEVLDAEQLEQWMQSVNAVRLVLGTVLDVTEDGDWRDDERLDGVGALYEALGWVLGHLVIGASAALPDDEPPV